MKTPQTLVLALLALAFWPVWRWYGLRLDDGSDEPMGALALATALWFLWREKDRLGCSGVSVRIATAGLLAYTAAFPFLPSMLRALLAIALLGGAFRLDRASPGIWGLLILSLPVVATAQFFAGWPLRVATAAAGTELLQLIGLDATRAGTVIHWRGVPVSVDAPCSGVKMLWSGLFFHFALASHRKMRLSRLVWLTPLAVAVILLANTLRAVLLFFKEGGWVTLPNWTHEGIGLLVFTLMLGAFAWMHRARLEPRESKKAEFSPPGRADLALLGVMAIATATMPLWNSAPARAQQAEVIVWPTQWEGVDLTPLPLSDQEKAFAADFPGSIAVFRTEEGPWSRRVILRRVERATRKLHSSADCLRAAGCELKDQPNLAVAARDERWAVWTAHGPDREPFRVRERFHESSGTGRQWTDVSSWFWSAALARSEGPWWAVTVIEPLP